MKHSRMLMANPMVSSLTQALFETVKRKEQTGNINARYVKNAFLSGFGRGELRPGISCSKSNDGWCVLRCKTVMQFPIGSARIGFCQEKLPNISYEVMNIHFDLLLAMFFSRKKMERNPFNSFPLDWSKQK